MSSSYSAGSVKPIAAASRRCSSLLLTDSPHGLDRRLVPAQVQVTPRRHDVDRLDLRGGRQHDVGVQRRVGHELLVHHREQVVAQQALANELGVGRDHQRVDADHHHRVHRRRHRRVGQHLAEAAHVDAAGHVRAGQVGPAERLRVDDLVRPTRRRCGRSRRRGRATRRPAPAGRRACGRTSRRARGARRRSACGSRPGGWCRTRGRAPRCRRRRRRRSSAARCGVHSATCSASSSKPCV